MRYEKSHFPLRKVASTGQGLDRFASYFEIHNYHKQQVPDDINLLPHIKTFGIEEFQLCTNRGTIFPPSNKF